MKRLSYFFVLAAALLTSGCSSDNESNNDLVPERVENVDETITDNAFGLTTGEMSKTIVLNDFALDFYRAAAARDSDVRSLVVSPVSTAFVLGMLNEGAEGQTSHEIEQVLGMDKTTAGGVFTKTIHGAPQLDAGVEVAFANNLSVNALISDQLSADYTKVIQDDYEASLFTLDFSSPQSADVINDWSSKHTRGLIPTIVGDLSPDAAMYVLNAIYFRGSWVDKFDAGRTCNESFLATADVSMAKAIRMMSKTAVARYCEQDDFKALQLPFAGGHYAMTFLLPHKTDGLRALVERIDAQTISALPFAEQQVEMLLPVFKTNTDTDLQPLLKTLGVNRLFSVSDSELTRILQPGNSRLFVSKMLQKASIGVDEEGSLGAAVTMAEMGFTSDYDPTAAQVLTFYANHPFVYMISELSTGMIFFIGQFAGE